VYSIKSLFAAVKLDEIQKILNMIIQIELFDKKGTTDSRTIKNM
jgi:hypothetical protein